jgi:DNA-binding PadR family transcriptional regulator
MRMNRCSPGPRAAWPFVAAMMMNGRRGGPWSWSWSWDDDGPPAPPPPPGGRRGPRGRMFASGELRLVLLKLIADETRHGYELIKAIEEMTGGRYAPSPGVVYPTLSLLLDEGAVEEVADDSPRKAFAATEAGRKELVDRAEEAERLIARLTRLNDAGEGHRAPPIGRAIGNLFAAMKGRAQEGFDGDTIHQVAEILDEAARKIERL